MRDIKSKVFLLIEKIGNHLKEEASLSAVEDSPFLLKGERQTLEVLTKEDKTLP